ncbi:unnamed protein product [Pleuronectes platessa]|uniref:Uncharacterized protein n=1 Tax=Pleuronectes platessa TaxID=8262 RepID=A0A9N7V9J9_PLEPL|nr:unnamed protein product [Pleuronectes platessa]
MGLASPLCPLFVVAPRRGTNFPVFPGSSRPAPRGSTGAITRYQGPGCPLSRSLLPRWRRGADPPAALCVVEASALLLWSRVSGIKWTSAKSRNKDETGCERGGFAEEANRN